MKKSIAVAISFMTILASTTAVFSAGYTDVKQGNWAFEAVNAMSEKAIVKGYPDSSFKPNNTVTYGEFIKMALIADTGEDTGNSASGHWADGYYNKALEKGYFTEYDIAKSQLEDKITRGDMALIISAILGDIKIENYDEIQEGIEDINYLTKHEYDITKSYACGILAGYMDNTFRPDKTLSRAESAMVIYRLVDESKRAMPGGKTENTTATAVTVPVYRTSDLLDMSKLTKEVLANDAAKVTEKYEFYTDASKWGIRLNKEFDGRTCSFDSTLPGLIYLVKEGIIIEDGISFPMSDGNGNYLGYQRSMLYYDIKKADYILSIPVTSQEDEFIKVVENPFKN